IAESPVVAASLTLREFSDQRVLESRNWRQFLVSAEDGQLLGTIAVDDLRTIPSDQWANTTVQACVTPIEPSLVVESDRPLSDVVKLLAERQITALSVVRANGHLVGLLEKAAIVQLLQGNPAATPA
ncbi:MAG: CBS domain-containing protein, partial [Leptolyngbyaceae cyanobacterium bins.349]|nr:CBS domain-containing protein [Leptolyngbyaceae cyanobacterium bins.349]